MEGFTLSGFADEISPDLERQIEVLQRLGMSYMEIRGVEKRGVDTYPAQEVRQFKKRLDEAGIKVSSLASPIGKIEITDDFSGHLEHFKHVADLAHILETPYIRMFSFFIPKGKDAGIYKGRVTERLGALVSCAKSAQVTLLHENEKDIYGDVPERCKELMEEFYGDHFKAVFDFANFVQCGQDAEEAFEMLRPYIEYVHIKDARMADQVIVPAGQGDGKIKEILSRLKAGGYSGFLSLEPHLAEFDGLKGLERDGASLQGMGQMSGEDAFTLAFESLECVLGEI